MMGDECKDDCACSGHGKCTAGQGIGDFFGFGFGLGDSDDKTCQCDPGWTGHDCSQSELNVKVLLASKIIEVLVLHAIHLF